MVAKTSMRGTLERYLELKGKEQILAKELNEVGTEILDGLGHGRYRVGKFMILVTVTQGNILTPPEKCIDVFEIPEELR